MHRATHSPNETLVVMYHYVGQESPGTHDGFVSLAEHEFDRQVSDLLAHHRPVDWPAFIDPRRASRAGNGRSVLFTFDDGLLCQAERAAVVLERHDLRGVFFIPSAVLQKRKLLDAHKLHILLSMHTDTELIDAVASTAGFMAPAIRVADCVDHQAADRMYHYEPSRLRRRLKYLLSTGLPARVRSEILGTLFCEFVGDERDWSATWYAPADAWRDLAARGHTIGAHGHSHERLESLDPDAQLADLTASVETIAERIGVRPTVMSFPLGSYDRSTIAAAKSAGFVAAMSTRSALHDGAAGPYEIPRVDCARIAEFLPEPAGAHP
jgi:peptidoglycan/xylan/chitin deacetylase (PgdA/CDA1 family)